MILFLENSDKVLYLCIHIRWYDYMYITISIIYYIHIILSLHILLYIIRLYMEGCDHKENVNGTIQSY